MEETTKANTGPNLAGGPMGNCVFHYRCPECHHIVSEERLFERGCPICGWTSPLKSKRYAEKICPSLEAMVDTLPSEIDSNAFGRREIVKKERKCPICGNERKEKELMEKGAERKALVDVIDELNSIRVVMEAPRMGREDLKVRILGNQKLVVETPSEVGEIDLPCPVVGGPVVSLRHGTLEVRMKKHAH